MVEKLSIEIALTGVSAIDQQIAKLSASFKSLFGEAEQGANSFAKATESIASLGNTAAEALTNAAAAAKQFGASSAELQKVESVISALNARSKDGTLLFADLARNYDNARAAAGSFGSGSAKAEQAAKTTGKAVKELGLNASAARGAIGALAQGINVLGGAPIGRLVTAAANIGTRFGAIVFPVAAIAGGAAALIKFAAAAEETEKALTQLQAVSSQSFSNLSALSNAFAQGGTPLKQFATEFGNLSEKIASAGEQAAKQDAIQKQAEDVAKGFRATSLAAITLDERVNKLLQSLSRVPPEDQWFKLADIFKSLGSDAERARIGKALGLSPESIATLSLGSDKLREMADQAKQLGVALNDVDKHNLSELRAGQTQAGALFDALKDKMGALVAPALASFWQGFTAQLRQLIPVFTEIARSIGQLDFSSLGAAAANFIAVLAKIAAGWAAVVQGQVSLKDVLTQMVTEAIPVAVELGVAIGTGIVSGILSAIAEKAGAIWEAIKQAVGFGSASPLAGGAPIGGAGGGIGSHAGGGLLGGRGTGTSDSNLAWLSRGEYITPARAVRQPGVLAFLEALRRSGGNLSRVLDGMGHFALGGMVPRAIPAFASGGLAGGMSNVTIQFPGLPDISGLRASSDVVDQLHRAAAQAQVRSGGRKPSRYS